MSKYQVGVYVTECDLQHSVMKKVLLKGGFIEEKDIVGGLIVYNEKTLQTVLRSCFGFKDGEYEIERVSIQKNRIDGLVVKNKNRYVGIERQDKGWVGSEMASQEVKEISKFGEPLCLT